MRDNSDVPKKPANEWNARHCGIKSMLDYEVFENIESAQPEQLCHDNCCSGCFCM